RTDRPRQGMRGADRVLQPLREGRGRGDARVDGREADVAARGALHPLRRPAVRRGAAPGPRSRDGRRLPLTLREPVAAGAGGNGGLYYADRDEFVEALKLLVSDPSLRRALGANGRDYVRRNYRWDVVLAKYEAMLAKVRGAG